MRKNLEPTGVEMGFEADPDIFPFIIPAFSYLYVVIYRKYFM